MRQGVAIWTSVSILLTILLSSGQPKESADSECSKRVLPVRPSLTIAQKRVKRILNGVLFTKSDRVFDVLPYYATIASAHEYPWWTLGFSWVLYAAAKRGYYGDITCGGALITPDIVQTACHCLSYWNESPDFNNVLRRPVVQREWEGVRVVYVGVTSQFYDDDRPSMLNVDPIRTKRFLVHPLCGIINHAPYPRSHDFGWISVDENWMNPDSRVPKTGVSFAPLYPEKDIKTMLKQTELNKILCMHVGFGYFRATGRPQTSSRLRVGWGFTLGPSWCLNMTIPTIMDNPGLRFFFSWFCVESITSGVTMPGDSGGPVVCNDVLVGFVSMHIDQFYRDEDGYLIERFVSMHGTLIADAFAMYAEYRESFLRVTRALFRSTIGENMPFRKFAYVS